MVFKQDLPIDMPPRKRPKMDRLPQRPPLWQPNGPLYAGSSANPTVQWATTATPAVYLSATDVLEGT